MLIGIFATFPLSIINYGITNKTLRLLYAIIPGMYLQYFVFDIG